MRRLTPCDRASSTRSRTPLAGRAVDPDLADSPSSLLALRAERPAPGPRSSRTLDTRVERRFPRPPPW